MSHLLTPHILSPHLRGHNLEEIYSNALLAGNGNAYFVVSIVFSRQNNLTASERMKLLLMVPESTIVKRSCYDNFIKKFGRELTYSEISFLQEDQF